MLIDNGGEFSNDLFHVLSEEFNINVKTTPGESPWSNGIVDCHNAVLEKMVNKLMLDENNKYPIDVIVAWAVSAKNAYAVTLEIAFFMIGVFQRLVVKPSFEKFVLMILL